MEQELKSKSYFPLFIHLVYLLFFFSLFFSLRAINSISIALLLLTGIFYNWKKLKWPSKKEPIHLFLIGCLLYFVLQIIGLLFTESYGNSWKDIQLKSGVAIIPLAVYFSGYVNKHTAKKLLAHYCLLLTVAILYCLFFSIKMYLESSNSSTLFYHQLVAPLKQHAVYFSIYVFVALVFLLENLQIRDIPFYHKTRLLLIILFSVFLFLLSSKIIIVFVLLYFLFFLTGLIKQKSVGKKILLILVAVIAAISSIILSTDNPISNRFRDMLKGNVSVIQQEKFAPGDYFNGIEFRLLQWKLVPVILQQHNSWWTGVGAANAQVLLDQQYISRNMYTGDHKIGQRGYQGYNTHNQWLESLLKNGIPGILVFGLICFAVVKIILHSRYRSNRFILLLLVVYSGVESVFETQYGIALFTLFVSFVCLAEQEPTFD